MNFKDYILESSKYMYGDDEYVTEVAKFAMLTRAQAEKYATRTSDDVFNDLEAGKTAAQIWGHDSNAGIIEGYPKDDIRAAIAFLKKNGFTGKIHDFDDSFAPQSATIKDEVLVQSVLRGLTKYKPSASEIKAQKAGMKRGEFAALDVQIDDESKIADAAKKYKIKVTKLPGHGGKSKYNFITNNSYKLRDFMAELGMGEGGYSASNKWREMPY